MPTVRLLLYCMCCVVLLFEQKGAEMHAFAQQLVLTAAVI